jgi:hypothetical protein
MTTTTYPTYRYRGDYAAWKIRSRKHDDSLAAFARSAGLTYGDAGWTGTTGQWDDWLFVVEGELRRIAHYGDKVSRQMKDAWPAEIGNVKAILAAEASR